jgi:hypothetical protein
MFRIIYTSQQSRNYCLFLIFLSCTGFLFGQQSNAFDSFIQYRFNGFIRLQNGSKYKLQGINYSDSNHLKIFTKNTIPLIVNGQVQYTYKGDPRTLETRMLSIENIKILKANHHPFLKGAAAGGSIGFIIGGILAKLASDDNIIDSNDDLKTGLLPVLLGVPLATIGGIGAELFVERRFVIKGNYKKLQEALDKTYQ